MEATIYLDHAAATPVDSRVLAAMLPYFTDKFYNPSAIYSDARQVHADIESARAAIARYLGALPAEIVFTAGGSEANNMAVKGVMDWVIRRFPAAKLAMSAIEHDSVMEAGKQYEHTILPVTEHGIADLDSLLAMVDDQTVLISVMYANNEIGTIQPVREIGRLVKGVRGERRRRGIKTPLYFHSDAAQAANFLDLQTSRLGVDLLTINGGKMYGPKQSGALYIRGGVQLEPLVLGGGQEQGLRSGTENVPAIIGLGRALEIAQNTRRDETKRLGGLQEYFFTELTRMLPEAVINGSRKKRLPNNLHFTLPGHDNERLLYQLDEAGIRAAAGSACGASSDKASHVLQALGLTEGFARSSLRLTMGRATTKAELDRTLDILRKVTGL